MGQEPPPGTGINRYPIPSKPEPERFRDKIGLPGWAVLLLVPLVILLSLYLVTLFIGRPYVVRGTSMYPTLDEGDRVFVTKYNFGATPSRGDVVVLKNVVEQPELLIKRVVAIGGDRLNVENGRIVVNDRYVHTSVNTRVARPYTELVPDNSIFVMGDNESHSYDSRMFGTVSFDKVVGRAVFIFWPLGRASKL